MDKKPFDFIDKENNESRIRHMNKIPKSFQNIIFWQSLYFTLSLSTSSPFPFSSRRAINQASSGSLFPDCVSRQAGLLTVNNMAILN
jgi:hypothetical protein